MIPPPQKPQPAGNGNLIRRMREIEKKARMAIPVGRGVSTGPLGSAVRTGQPQKPAGGTATAIVWL
jgi:hypothetical protein